MDDKFVTQSSQAGQFAQCKRKDFCYAHLKHAIGVAGKFDKYIKSVKESFSDDEIARGEQPR